MRIATSDDIPALSAFLQARIETSMFLLGNLEAHGTDERENPHGTQFFLCEDAGHIIGVFGATVGGYLMCQAPGLTMLQARDFAGRLHGYTMRGMTGATDQVVRVLEAIGVPDHLWAVNRDEPLFALDLARLADDPADSGVQIRGPDKRDFALLAQWFGAYGAETGTDQPDAAMLRAETALTSPTLCLMIEEGTPVAMADINAAAGDAVQIGGVFVPPEFRNQGRAGRVVQKMLGQLRARGCARAILFAGSEPAARAYARIGFERIGNYRVAVPAQRYRIGEPT